MKRSKPSPKTPTPEGCLVPGCPRQVTVRVHGLCQSHYIAHRRKGLVTSTRQMKPRTTPKAPPGSGSITSYGYRRVYVGNHPLAMSPGIAYEHRVVLYDEIGGDDDRPHWCRWCRREVFWFPRPGRLRLVVDHINGDPLDNRPENLVPSCYGCNSWRTRRLHRTGAG